MSADILNLLSAMLDFLPYFFAAIFILIIAKFFFDLSTPKFKLDRQLTEKDNPAIGLAFGGYTLALAIALTGSLRVLDSVSLDSIIDLIISSVASILLLRLSMFINDKCILYSFSIQKELLKDRNTGVGFMLTASFVASGFILAGIMEGSGSGGILLMLLSILVYWLVGQVMLILAALLYRLTVGYKVLTIIEKDDNGPAGLAFGGYIVSFGIIIGASFRGASDAIVIEIITAIIIYVAALICFTVAYFLTDTIFLPKARIAKEISEQRNWAAATVVSSLALSIALLFNAVQATLFIK